jgi:hypothetical protein
VSGRVFNRFAFPLGWVESLQKNDAEAKESLIRALLADAGAMKPKVFVFRRH